MSLPSTRRHICPLTSQVRKGVLFIIETLPQLRVYSGTFFVLDGVISTFFLVDYSLRLYAAYGHYKLRPLGPVLSRLRWLATWSPPSTRRPPSRSSTTCSTASAR